mmetsp:Transcript_7718/g.21836  ORF Transcript_7718/g.21836 Transcript_7718/m.21836 type:complete len:217 (-) Transcript_7718:590-1240(-)
MRTSTTRPTSRVRPAPTTTRATVSPFLKGDFLLCEGTICECLRMTLPAEEMLGTRKLCDRPCLAGTDTGLAPALFEAEAQLRTMPRRNCCFRPRRSVAAELATMASTDWWSPLPSTRGISLKEPLEITKNSAASSPPLRMSVPRGMHLRCAARASVRALSWSRSERVRRFGLSRMTRQRKASSSSVRSRSSWRDLFPWKLASMSSIRWPSSMMRPS